MKHILSLLIFCSVALAKTEDDGFVGVFADKPGDFWVVVYIMEGSPAANADIRVGDRIISIDGVPTTQMKSAKDLIGRASGHAGSEIELELQRPGLASSIRIRLRRILGVPARPNADIPPDFNPNEA